MILSAVMMAHPLSPVWFWQGKELCDLTGGGYTDEKEQEKCVVESMSKDLVHVVARWMEGTSAMQENVVYKASQILKPHHISP